MFRGYVVNVKEWKTLLIHMTITRLLIMYNKLIILSPSIIIY
jgi:hypothetical protein